ncbi:MAG TPA: hypothetical protein VFE51_17495 [Verrucomicrobiae bacterium]|nr:hypothetical protein [Verrucomicrobiae bacterium]
MARAEGGAVSSADAARLLGVSEKTVLNRWRHHRLVGWKKRTQVFFPVWQFRDGQPLPGVEEILGIFSSDDHWRIMGYFLLNRLSLGEQRPLDLLREGKVALVIQHAKAYGKEDLW